MFTEKYIERSFVVETTGDGVYSCGIEANSFDSGKTDTAWVELVDDESGELRAFASVQVQTNGDQRFFPDKEIVVNLSEPDGKRAPLCVTDKLLGETRAADILRQVCHEEDQRDSFQR
jgi:hypothetical protein